MSGFIAKWRKHPDTRKLDAYLGCVFASLKPAFKYPADQLSSRDIKKSTYTACGGENVLNSAQLHTLSFVPQIR